MTVKIGKPTDLRYCNSCEAFYHISKIKNELLDWWGETEKTGEFCPVCNSELVMVEKGDYSESKS
ncbi:MAG: hypothetical protein DDT41_01518 [candidate division WS2 bacterium]|nr:hypothetical protein [Candidatus Psychracetigena formicireducens]